MEGGTGQNISFCFGGFLGGRSGFGRVVGRARALDFDLDLLLAGILFDDSDSDSDLDSIAEKEGGGAETYKSNKDRTYAFSALGTGSPSFTNAKNINFLYSLFSGFCSGRKETGGAPNVTQ